jgi:hypothetical protein
MAGLRELHGFSPASKMRLAHSRHAPKAIAEKFDLRAYCIGRKSRLAKGMAIPMIKLELSAAELEDIIIALGEKIERDNAAREGAGDEMKALLARLARAFPAGP